MLVELQVVLGVYLLLYSNSLKGLEHLSMLLLEALHVLKKGVLVDPKGFFLLFDFLQLLLGSFPLGR